MPPVNCKMYDDTSFLIPKKYGKNTHERMVNKLGGEWLPSRGWKIDYAKWDKLIDYADLLFSGTVFNIEHPPPKDDSVKDDSSDEEDVVSSGRFKRASSAGKTKSSNHPSYYQTFKKSAEDFSNLVFDDDHVELSSSSDEDESDDNSQSSEDFPNRSPNRRVLVNDETVDKLETLRRRMVELDVKDRKKKKK